jgi:hypothetical protein
LSLLGSWFEFVPSGPLRRLDPPSTLRLFLGISLSTNVNGNGIISGQKTSKFFVSHMEESREELMDINGIY